MWCSIEMLYLPKSVNNIGYCAFGGCSALNVVEVNWDKPSDVPVFDDIFLFLDLSKIELIVPIGTQQLYAVADVWKNFGNITSVSNEVILKNDVCFSNGVLSVNNTIAERIYIYTISGQLIWTDAKFEYPERFYIGYFHRGIYIVYGESGWNFKISI